MKDLKYDICIVGCGRIGLSLAVMFASKNLKVLMHDINRKNIDIIFERKFPFIENNYQEYLNKALDNNCLFFSDNPNDTKYTKNIIITIGTDLDKHNNPATNHIIKCIDQLSINNNQLIILRSTLAPGVSDYVYRHLKSKNLNPDIAFCPERIVEGRFFEEISIMPQIVGGFTETASNRAAELFKNITKDIIFAKPLEAELIKLFCNSYRYINFAITNSFYEIATLAGLNYNEILEKAKQNYSRLDGLPSAGFANGPCLGNSTMTLASHSPNSFYLGKAAIDLNEGLPAFLVDQLEKKYTTLKNKTILLCGMGFKKHSDDIRSSLSYKLKKICKFKCKTVLTTDNYVSLTTDPELLPLTEGLINKSDIIIICIPNDEYLNLKQQYPHKEIVNIWND